VSLIYAGNLVKEILLKVESILSQETLKGRWRYMIPAEPQIHNHMLIPNYQDITFQDFRYSDGFECYQVIKIERYEHQMELAVEQHREEKYKFQNKMENILQENDRLLTQALSVEIVNVVVHDNAQAKNTEILKLKEKLCSLNGDVNERTVKREVEEIETLNIELDHKEKVLVITALKVQLNKLKGKAVISEVVSLSPIDPELLKVDVASLVPKLRKNRTAHTDYIRHTQEEAATLREIVESERLLSLLNTSLFYAYSKATSSVINYVTNLNSDMKCASCNGCLLSDNHDACVVAYKNSVNASKKSKSVKTPVKRKVWKTTGKVFKSVGHIWKPTGRIFTLVEIECPLTRIATPTIVPPREPIPIVNSTDKPVVTLYLDSGCSKHITEDRSQLVNFVQKFLGTVEFGNDHVVKIMGYGDYQIGNVTISEVYYVEGLGHNLFFVGQFCDSDLEVAFRQHTCFIRNLDGVDLLTGSRGNNLYTLSIQDIMASSPICLLSKHPRPSHGFGIVACHI
nr:hypothetical protein [Tanacetum cinerariifolium]